MTEKSNNKILVGPAGSCGGDIKHFEEIKKLGLDAVEIEFVHGIWLDKERANIIREANKNLKLKLSIHAPYFINLNSEDKQKVGASRTRILQSCIIGNELSNGENIPIVFHPGFYLKSTKQECYNKIKEEILKIQQVIDEKNLKVDLCPETTGKESQFGSLDEILQLMKDTKCHICVDFAHLKARYNGKINYDEVMNKIKNIKNLHAHFSGIEYTEKGERKHLLTQEKDIKELFHYLKEYNIGVNIINESPNPFGDAIKMKKLL